MNNELDMRNNLIQNFYVIGLPIEEIIDTSLLITKEKSFDIYIEPSRIYYPKIISKFPPIDNNFNKILDDLVITHCFPNNIKIKEGKKYSDHTYQFEFELDNKLYKFIDKNKHLYSSIHFTCLKFYESIKDYKKLKDNIYNKLKEDENKTNIASNMINDGRISLGSGNPIYYIPKVICFASLIPFPIELHKILVNIYDFYKYQSIKFNKKDFIYYPMEKIIEQVVMSLPLPISNSDDIVLSFNIEQDSFDIYKNILTYPKITFNSYNLRDYYLDKSYNLSLIEMFNYFTEENIIKTFKHIIFENPILFFCQEKEILSNIIEGFLSILSPFKYTLPFITILPSKYFGLIHSQDKFIFGINHKYSENFFTKNEINLNKNIIIVSIDTKNMNSTKIEEIKNENDKIKNIYINQEDIEENFPSNLNDIDLPQKHKKKLLSKLKNYLNYIKTNLKKKKLESTYSFNNKIRHIFHKFFVNILSGYTQFLSKSPNQKFFGDNIRHKYNGKNGLIRYIKEIFEIDEFISNFPKESQMFYKAFFNTELFFNFIRGIIYPSTEIDSLKHKYFDFTTFLKKNKDLRKHEDFKDQYEQYKIYKNSDDSQKNHSKKYITISNKYYFTFDEKKILLDKSNQKIALIKYNQLIESNENFNDSQLTQIIFSIRYFLFPKLLFDNKFFKENYNSQFYHHYIELPNNSFIQELNKALKISENDFITKYCHKIYSNPKNAKMNDTNFIFGQNNNNLNHSHSNQNFLFELYIHNYIEYNWLLLLSCSLWYCNSNKEKEVRINKIFNILEKLDYIEEQVLFFNFYSLYKYANSSQFIRIFEFLYRFIGSYSYYDLILLYKKLDDLKENENNKLEKINENNDNEKDNKTIIQRRSFYDIKKYVNIKENDDKLKEEIIFSTEQICHKCGKIIKLAITDISDIINKKIDHNQNYFLYKCKNCDEFNSNIIIKYYIILNNIKKNKEEKLSEGTFNLVMPHILFQEIKKYVINLKDNNLDIDHIFSNNNINLLNFIFYFSLNCLPFDFLIPYEKNENEKYDRDYFDNNIYNKNLNLKENNEQSKTKFNNLTLITSNNLSLSGNND